MLPSLAAALLLSTTPGSTPDHCGMIRTVRGLASQARLDERTLLLLEQQHCHRPPGPSASEDCQTLWLMSRLARVGGAPEQQAQAVETLRDVSCASSGPSEPTLTWPGGVTARSRTGTWSWPSGLTARDSKGRWSWHTGLTARNPGGVWYYPSGITARSAQGTWSRPDGLSTSEKGLLTAFCQARPDDCQAYLQGLSAVTGDLRDLAVMQMALETRR